MAGSDSTGGSGFVATLDRLTPLHKIAVGAAVLTLVAGFFVFSSSGGDDVAMGAVYTDLEPADAASVTEELLSRGVDYDLADGGRTVLVPKDEVYDLRIALSGQGLPTYNEGYALLDKQGITTSEFRQRIDYQRALEGELSRTLRSIDGVESATVHLALPEDSVFVDEPSRPTASVLVATAASDAVTGDQVAAMVHLVAASVKDMAPADVTIADAAGRVLTDGTGAATGSAVGGDASATFETDLATELRTMVGRVAGMENVAVNVEADLELTERQETSERFDSTDEDGVVTGERVGTETYEGAGGLPGETGVLGPDGAPVAQVGAGGGDSTYTKDDAERTYAVNRTVEQVVYTPGTVKRLSVAVLVDETVVTAEQSEAISEMIATAAGIDTERGDQLSVTRLPFTVADTTAADVAATEAAALAEADQRASLIRTAIIGFVVLVAMLLAYRSARKARREVSTPIDIGAIRSAPLGGADALTAGSSDDGAPTAEEHVVPALDPSILALEELSTLADRRPDEVAQILQSWLSDEGIAR
ncbi:flagellar basal-body MS-ring/collar protein FliF [Ilumatobacter sp.]|uniref:flagellar basal-body MS-ring/collar protein FliF n=1 Tax=Ilumatobacter sp. TaxID=1967498 RepID=UPI003B522272